ncbi:MAG: rhodanese-like domain-containing protein [Thiogranum sp.]
MSGIQEIDSTQLAEMVAANEEEYLLVDVRSPAEMAHGMLAGAEAVPMHLVPLRLEEWRNKKKIVVYCRTGARSGHVCAWLQQQGVGHAVNLSGGIVDWHRQGYPVEKPDNIGIAS